MSREVVDLTLSREASLEVVDLTNSREASLEIIDPTHTRAVSPQTVGLTQTSEVSPQVAGVTRNSQASLQAVRLTHGPEASPDGVGLAPITEASPEVIEHTQSPAPLSQFDGPTGSPAAPQHIVGLTQSLDASVTVISRTHTPEPSLTAAQDQPGPIDLASSTTDDSRVCNIHAIAELTDYLTAVAGALGKPWVREQQDLATYRQTNVDKHNHSVFSVTDTNRAVEQWHLNECEWAQQGEGGVTSCDVALGSSFVDNSAQELVDDMMRELLMTMKEEITEACYDARPALRAYSSPKIYTRRWRSCWKRCSESVREKL